LPFYVPHRNKAIKNSNQDIEEEEEEERNVIILHKSDGCFSATLLNEK
jgi:hypothetical protein